MKKKIVAILLLVVIGAALLLGATNAFALRGTQYLFLPVTVSGFSSSRIAFVSDRDVNREIYVMNPSGGALNRLTNNLAPDDYPAWSPDGKHLAFASLRDGNYELYTMDGAGGSLLRITNNAALDSTPRWSPDGSQLVFTTAPDAWQTDLAVVPSGGSVAPTVLRSTGGMTYHAGPDWSANGRIAFTHVIGVSHFPQILTMKADGTDVVQLTTGGLGSHFAPAWSPDGSRIAFASDRDSFGNVDVYVMNADGSSITRLTSDPAWDGNPAWSPDGSKIAFDTARDGNREIYVMNSDGSNVVRLTNNPAYDGSPTWSHY